MNRHLTIKEVEWVLITPTSPAACARSLGCSLSTIYATRNLKTKKARQVADLSGLIAPLTLNPPVAESRGADVLGPQ